MRAFGLACLPLLLAACEAKDLLPDLPDAAPAAEIDAGCVGCYPIYLNRHPVTIEPAGDEPSDSVANTSVLVTEEVTTAGSRLSEHDWAVTVACVRALFAPFPVVITEIDPGDVDHLEVIVTHSPEELGWPTSTVVNASASACGAGRREITFAFSGLITTPQRLCEFGVGFTAGRAAGLSSSGFCPDIMAQGHWWCEKSFLDEELGCGFYGDEPCLCGGDTQNSYQTMQAYYGGLRD
jgi:hypothetical protein